MFSDSQFDCFDPSIARLIRRKAKSLIGKSGITRSDVPDVEQHLALCLFKAMQAFDRDRGHLMPWAVTV